LNPTGAHEIRKWHGDLDRGFENERDGSPKRRSIRNVTMSAGVMVSDAFDPCSQNRDNRYYVNFENKDADDFDLDETRRPSARREQFWTRRSYSPLSG